MRKAAAPRRATASAISSDKKKRWKTPQLTSAISAGAVQKGFAPHDVVAATPSRRSKSR